MANAKQAMAALSDPTRGAIFEQLSRGPKSVGEIAASLPVTRPAVSQHLKVLKDARLVSDEAVGTPGLPDRPGGAWHHAALAR